MFGDRLTFLRPVRLMFLCLDGLTELSDAAAESLSKREGFLCFGGSNTITSEVASSLVQFKAETLSLGVTSLDDLACELLSSFKGALNLFHLEEVSQIGAKWLLEQGNVNEYCPVDLEAIASGEEDDDDEEWED